MIDVKNYTQEKDERDRKIINNQITKKPIRVITLQKFDEHFEDFYDSEQKLFVIYAGTRGFDGSIDTDVKVKDDDGVVWDCYLWSVMYIPSMDTYEIYYKPYGE